MLRRLHSHLIPSSRLGYWLVMGGFLGTIGPGHSPSIAEAVPVELQHPRIYLLSQANPGASTVSGRPVLQPGARGEDISELQATLKLLGYYNGPVDGVYNQTTATAVSQFQRAAGLAPDGIVGPATWNRLYPPVPGAPTSTPPPVATTPSRPATPTAPPKQPAPTPVAQTPPASVNFPVLRKGMKGPAVVSLQERLQAVGVLKGGADGVFGDETEAAVKAAQAKYGLEVDGIVGPATWGALMR